MEPSMVGCTVRFSAVAQDEMWGAWLTVKGFECRGARLLFGLDGLEFFERASWVRARSFMRYL